MDLHERATRVWYRTAGLASRGQKDLAVEIIEAEIRSAQHEVFIEAAKLVLSAVRTRDVVSEPRRHHTTWGFFILRAFVAHFTSRVLQYRS
jgi:hypothetical protein